MRSALTPDQRRQRGLAASRAWYHRNIDRERERSRKKLATAYERNRDAILRRNREWAKRNAEKIKARQRQYRLENAEKRKLQNQIWRKLHGKEWRIKNLQKHRLQDIVSSHKRRALKKSAAVNLRSIQAWMKSVKQRTFSTCYYCGSRVRSSDIHFDHIVALSTGGPHSVENLCVSCAPCNLSKNAKSVTEWLKIGQQVFPL